MNARLRWPIPAPLRPLSRALAGALLLVAAGCAHAPPPAAPTPAVPAGANPFGPGFTSRGVIEGFYGPPWSWQDRLDMLRFMGRMGMNTYFYGPKDDPYHRERWRDPYPADQIARIGELVKAGRAAGVNLWFAVSPGLSMRYSDDADYRALLAKLDAVGAVGVKHVGLFLDDVPETLTHAEDRARFSSLAAAHAYLIQRLKADLDARGVALAVVQTTYTDSFGSKDYLRELGSALPPQIPLAWTGTDVLPPVVTVAEARDWAAMIQRSPLLWDNYPVNDFARWRLFLGPLAGRAPDLPTAVQGYLGNPMNEAHASMLPLWTTADYLRDPEHYDPAAAEERALSALYGATPDSARARRGVDAMRAFVAAYGNHLGEPGPIDDIYIPSRAFDFAASSAVVQRMRAALPVMAELAAADSATWSPLVRELTPFADSAAARLARLRADTLFALRGDSLVFRAELDRIVAGRPASPPVVDGQLADWPAQAWRGMYSARGLAARVALAADASTLFIALQVPDTAVITAAGEDVASGDHVAIVIEGDSSGTATRMTGADLLVLATPPGAAGPGSADARSLAFGYFVKNAVAEHENFTFSSFMLGYSAPPAAPFAPTAAGMRMAAARDAAGWRMEIALPRAGLPVRHTPAGDVLHLAIVAADMKPGPARLASLGPRNYAANPATWTELVLPR